MNKTEAVKKIRELYSQKKYQLALGIVNDSGMEFDLPDYDVRLIRKKLENIDRISINESKRILEAIMGSAESKGTSMNDDTECKRVFIVHGWDANLRMETELFFRKRLDMECIVLFEQDPEGLTIIDKFEKYAAQADVAIVLMSDQDENTESLSDPNAAKRPRPNVLFEMGYFFSKIGRRRTLIFKKGKVEIHSDIYGIEYIDVTSGVESQSENIRRRLKFIM